MSSFKIVIEFGTAMVKIGIAGENVPRIIVRTPVTIRKMLNTPRNEGGCFDEKLLLQEFNKLFHEIFFKYV